MPIATVIFAVNYTIYSNDTVALATVTFNFLIVTERFILRNDKKETAPFNLLWHILFVCGFSSYLICKLNIKWFSIHSSHINKYYLRFCMLLDVWTALFTEYVSSIQRMEAMSRIE